MPGSGDVDRQRSGRRGHGDRSVAGVVGRQLQTIRVLAIGRQHLTGAQSMHRTLIERVSLRLALAAAAVPSINDAWISE